MSSSPEELLDLNPIQEFVQKELSTIKQELQQRGPAIQKRRVECEGRIKIAIEDDVPETTEMLRKNAELRKRIVSERDERIKIFDDLIAEIDAKITVLPDLEENIDKVESLKKDREQVSKRIELIRASTDTLIERLDANESKTLKPSYTIIAQTIAIGKETIENEKSELALLKEKERRFTISAEQLHSSADSVSSNSIPSPRLNGGL